MKIVQLNGVGCCILNLPCCKPPGSPAQALAKVISRAVGDKWDADVCRDAAESILLQFDLVPKGVGQAIGEAYYPIIRHALEQEAGREAPMTTDPDVISGGHGEGL